MGLKGYIVRKYEIMNREILGEERGEEEEEREKKQTEESTDNEVE